MVMPDDDDVKGRSRVPAVTRGLAAMKIISEGPASLADIARRLKAPKSSVLGICQALVLEGLAVRDDGGRYALGPAILELAAAERAQPRRLRTLAVAVPDSTPAFYAAEITAIQDAAEEHGCRVEVRDAGRDARVQIEQIRELVAGGVDALLLDSVDSTALAASVQLARARGVTVVAVNVGVEGADATVTTDNIHAGQLAAGFLVAAMGSQGEVAIVDGEPVTATADRVSGFTAILRDHPQVRVVAHLRADHTMAGGEHAADHILDKHPRLGGVFAINDPTALGVVRALHRRGRSLPVVSVDGAATASRVIAEGGLLQATVAQDPDELGRRAVRYAARIHAGDSSALGVRLLPTLLVTRDNVRDYQPWG